MRIALTPGEPAGIGPELAVRLAHAELPGGVEWVVFADAELLEQRAALLGLPLSLDPVDWSAPPRATRKGELRIAAHALSVDSAPGVLRRENAHYVLDTLAAASDACASGACQALVTGPVHKAVLNEAGVPFTGHTEFFAQRTRSDVLMLLAAPSLRVALATTHLPLSEVPRAITREGLRRTLEILREGLRARFGCAEPRIVVLGLNPHAGESGHLGREEIDTIIPVLEELRARGWRMEGPLPADTAFLPERLPHTDAFLAMYHDQGLPVLKALGFGAAVNITLGLPYVRTSVDHGVALDLAGSGRADASSLIAAAALALELAQRSAAAAGSAP